MLILDKYKLDIKQQNFLENPGVLRDNYSHHFKALKLVLNSWFFCCPTLWKLVWGQELNAKRLISKRTLTDPRGDLFPIGSEISDTDFTFNVYRYGYKTFLYM